MKRLSQRLSFHKISYDITNTDFEMNIDPKDEKMSDREISNHDLNPTEIFNK